MIHIFNRKELLTTFSLEQQGKVQIILDNNYLLYKAV